MNSIKRDIKILFLIFIVEMYLIATVNRLLSEIVDVREFIAQSMIFVLMTLIVILSRELRVVVILFFTLIYGGGVFLEVWFSNGQNLIGPGRYIILILMTVIGITMFLLMGKIEDIYQEALNRIDEKQLITIDNVTGFDNKTALIKDLKKEMLRSKRHRYPFVMMIVELQYGDELKKIYTKQEVDNIYLALANSITDLARVEDLKYRYDENKFVLLAPFTDSKGGEVIKNRFKDRLSRIEFNSEIKGDRILDFKYKISLKEYDKEGENPIELLNVCEKELEYDV